MASMQASELASLWKQKTHPMSNKIRYYPKFSSCLWPGDTNLNGLFKMSRLDEGLLFRDGRFVLELVTRLGSAEGGCLCRYVGGDGSRLGAIPEKLDFCTRFTLRPMSVWLALITWVLLKNQIKYAARKWHLCCANTHQLFFCCCSAATQFFLAASYTSSFAWIRILLCSVPSASSELQ